MISRRSVVGGATAITFALGLFSRSAPADESPYCRRVRAQAAGDAALLMAPRVIVQGIRYPSITQIGVGATVGNGFQVRTGLAFSPVDFYKGVQVERLGDAQCDAHESSETLQDLLAHAADAARLAALREEGGYLEEHRPDWKALAAKAQERLAARVLTLVEFDELRRHVDALERKRVQVRAEASQLEARDAELPRQPFAGLVGRYLHDAMRVERQASRIRSLDAWQFQVTLGAIPEDPIDWYGLAEVSYSLGGVARDRATDRYLDARSDELLRARYELPAQLRTLRNQISASIDEAHEVLETIDGQAESMNAARAALEQSDAPNVAHARDSLALELFSVESDRVFLRAWGKALTALLEDTHEQ